jgi:glycerol-3-phosphate dehydrogenase (NAD(P)+)
MKNITVIGAGAFGTSLALYSHNLGHKVKVWTFEKDLPDIINHDQENTVYLPGVKIPPEINFTDYIEDALEGTEVVLMVCPSAYMRKTAELASPFIPKNAKIASAAKGIENETLCTMNEVLEQALPDFKDSLAYLSGPSFAKDIAGGKPTDIACAARDIKLAREIRDCFHSPLLRIYSSDDVVGVELGGALKNIIAIACGAADGLGSGGSARASLMTRGLAEVTRLGVAMGAKP